MSEEEKPIAYRRLGRRSDGRMGTIYYDEDGNLIEYADLDNYNVNEIPGAFATDGEPDAPSSPSGPSAPRSYSSPMAEVGGESGQNPSNWNDGVDNFNTNEPIDPSTGLPPQPYIGPGEIDFMYDVRDKLGSWLENSKLVKGMNAVAGVTEKVTDKAEDFMRREEERRQRLQGQGIMTAEEVAETPETVASPRSVPTQSIDMAASPTVDDPILDGPGAGSIGTVPNVPSAGGSITDFVSAALSAPPGPEGGINTSLKDQLDKGFSTGQIRDQQLAEQEAMTAERDERTQTAFGEMQDMGTVAEVGTKTASDLAFSEGGDHRHVSNLSEEKVRSISDVARQLGVTPSELAGIIGTETADSFDPTKKNSYGYQGLIQFGREEKAQFVDPYGEIDDLTFDQQLRGPVMDFVTERGYRPGMGAEALYRTIHAGDPGAPVTATDFATGKTTQDTFYDWVEPRAKSSEEYIDALGDTKGPSPNPGNGEQSWLGLQGGVLSSDPRLGGYGGSQVFDSSPLSRQGAGFTAPTVSGSNRPVTTSSVRGFGGDPNSPFGPSTSSFGGIDSSRPATSGSSNGSGTSTQWGGSSGYGGYTGGNDYGGESSGNPGNDTSGGGGYDSSNSGGPGDYGNSSHDGYSQSDYDNNSSIGDWNNDNSWF